jgi:multidrug efflux system membrane fusion protein
VAPGDRIVIDGADKLRDGAKIDVRAATGASPPPDATKAAGQNSGQDKAGGGGKKRRPEDGPKQ